MLRRARYRHTWAVIGKPPFGAAVTGCPPSKEHLNVEAEPGPDEHNDWIPAFAGMTKVN